MQSTFQRLTRYCLYNYRVPVSPASARPLLQRRFRVSSMAASEASPAPVPAPTAQPKQKAPKAKKGKDDSLAGQMAALELNPPPGYIQHRVDMFDRLLKEYEQFVADQPREDINVELPDGSVKPAKSWETSPVEIAKSLSVLSPSPLVPGCASC